MEHINEYLFSFETVKFITCFYEHAEKQLSSNGELTVIERLAHLLDTGQFADVNVRVGKGTDQTVFKVSNRMDFRHKKF